MTRETITNTVSEKPFSQADFNLDVLTLLNDLLEMAEGKHLYYRLSNMRTRVDSMMNALEREHYREMAEAEEAERKRYDI